MRHRLGPDRVFLLPSGELEAELKYSAGNKPKLILSSKLLEIAITTVLALSGPTTYGVIGSQEPTYPMDESVNTTTSTQIVALSDEEIVIQEIIKTFPDAPVVNGVNIMVEVARCESNLDPSADRHGIDGGLFQINQVHLPELNKLGLDRYDLQDNLTYARKLYDQDGLRPWAMSKHCWS